MKHGARLLPLCLEDGAVGDSGDALLLSEFSVGLPKGTLDHRIFVVLP